MKHARILLALWLAGSAEIVVAGNFADSLRNFIVGSESQALPAPENPVDRIASDCLGCHDGSMPASEIVRNARGAGTIASTHDFRGDDDHPVGILYVESIRKDPGGYRPPAALNPKIRLVDGRMTCITCHQVKNEILAFNETSSSAQAMKPQCTATREITMGSLRDDKLCLACHVK